MACSNTSRQSESFIVNALELDIVIDKILEYLPIRKAAQTSVLSKQWRRNWLSLRSLVFDEDFQNEVSCTNEDKWSQIISNILLYHEGPVDYFELYDEEPRKDCMSQNPWLSFLSKNGIKKISIDNYSGLFDISLYIFCCSELVHLRLNHFSLTHTPTDFRGYRNLKHLELMDFYLFEENFFLSLVENCSMLAFLRLEHFYGIEHIIIDFPRLKTLIINTVLLQSIAFRNVQSLECISLSGILLYETVELIDADILANSSQLQSIKFDGSLCKSLAAGGILRSHRVTFNYLNKLRLSKLDSSDFGVFSSVLLLLESSPCIKMLGISFMSPKSADQRKLEYNYNHELAHLREIKIKRITGSTAELKLIEYLLAISPVLEQLLFTFSLRETESQLQMSKALMEFPRASTKARFVWLDQ